MKTIKKLATMKTTENYHLIISQASYNDDGSRTVVLYNNHLDNENEAIKEYDNFDEDPAKGCFIEVWLLKDEDEFKRRIIEGEDITGKLIVYYTHQTHLGYAHKYLSCDIAKKGMTTSDLNPEPGSAVRDIDNDVYDSFEEFCLFGDKYRFTTSFKDWQYKIALELGFSEEKIIELGLI